MAAYALMTMISALASVLSRSRTALRTAFRKLAVTAMAAGLALAPLPLASAHDPLALAAAESARHAALVAQEIAEHGHSHDDGEAHEQSGGHMHGHDPADHSHQFAFFAGSASQWGLPAPQRWPSVAERTAGSGNGLRHRPATEAGDVSVTAWAFAARFQQLC